MVAEEEEGETGDTLGKPLSWGASFKKDPFLLPPHPHLRKTGMTSGLIETEMGYLKKSFYDEHNAASCFVKNS